MKLGMVIGFNDGDKKHYVWSENIETYGDVQMVSYLCHAHAFVDLNLVHKLLEIIFKECKRPDGWFIQPVMYSEYCAKKELKGTEIYPSIFYKKDVNDE